MPQNSLDISNSKQNEPLKCMFCTFPPCDSQNPLVKTCSKGCTGHLKCFKNFLKREDISQKSPLMLQTFRELSLWLFDGEAFEENSILKCMLANPRFGHISIHRYDGNPFSTTFIDHKWPDISFLNSILLINSNLSSLGTYKCIRCSTLMYYFGQQPKLPFLKNWYIKLSNIALISWTLLAGLGILYSMNLTMSLFLISILGWSNDFFPLQPTGFDIIRAQAVTHLVYCLVSPNVSLLQSLIALLYSQFDLGVPLFGVNNNEAKSFLSLKVLGSVIDRLLLNRYYLVSFKKTIPSLFGQKLGLQDLLEIQDYRNKNNDQHYDSELSLWGKIKYFLKDTWTSLTTDISNLYKKTSFDFFIEYFGEVIVFITGLCIRPIVAACIKKLYHIESNKTGLSTLVGFGIVQLICYGISNYDAIMLSECYKNLKPNTNQVSDNEANWLPVYFNRSFGLTFGDYTVE